MLWVRARQLRLGYAMFLLLCSNTTAVLSVPQTSAPLPCLPLLQCPPSRSLPVEPP